MISDVRIAKKISDAMLDVSTLLNNSVVIIEKSDCSDQEKSHYYKIIGQLMGLIGIDVLNNLYRMHPNIKPKEYQLPEDF